MGKEKKEVFVLEVSMSEDLQIIIRRKNWWEMQAGIVLMSVYYRKPRSKIQAVMDFMAALLKPFTLVISFVIAKKWKNSIYKYCEVSNWLIEYVPFSFSSKPTQKEKMSFIKVNQSLICRTKLVKKVCSRKVSDVRLKLKRVNSKRNNVISVYAPTWERAK